MSKKKQPVAATSPFSPRIKNKKASFNYHFLEKLEAGLALVGTEVKSLRQGLVTMDESYCRIRGGEMFLMGCNIAPYAHGNIQNHEPTRPRKLLVHRSELKKIESKLAQKGLTVVPVMIYFKDGYAKVEIALAQGRAQYDKRDKLKKQQSERDMKRDIRRR